MLRALVSIAVLTAATSACKDAPDDEGFREQLDADDYRSFARAPGYESPREAGTGPHGAFVDIYVNDIVVDALAGGPLDVWPEGALVVKDGWGSADGDDWRYLAAMEKRGDEWFWAEYRGGDELAYAGLSEPACTRCHDDGDDGVLAFALPR